jgi:Protein of unknown function (DUF3128)
MQPKDVVDFGLFLSEWSKCLTATHQRDQLWRFGKFDDCSLQWKDVRNAAYAKLSNDQQFAEKVIGETFYVQRTTTSPTVGVIWELKDKPGWD